MQPGSALEGETLAEAALVKKTSLQPIALETISGQPIFNPEDNTTLTAGGASHVFGMGSS